MNEFDTLVPRDGDALIIVDVQNDFLGGGACPVPYADAIIPALNHYIAMFAYSRLPVIATRDWHTPDHCSFEGCGGTWPTHCVAGSAGACFPAALDLPERAIIVSKADSTENDASSCFTHTDLASRLQAMAVTRLYVGGLATGPGLLNTVLDGLREGHEVLLLEDAIRALESGPDIGSQPLTRMIKAGARVVSLERIAA